MVKKKTKSKYQYLIKPLLSVLYIGIMFILVYSAYQLFVEDQKEVNWNDVKKTDEYAWLEIDQMSEAFAEVDHKQIHFVMEKEETGAWHTYLIAIRKSDYAQYKELIDYTYERTEKKPNSMKLYGYPVEINPELRKLAIQNIKNFVPVENEIEITEKNFTQYLTDTYLDTTIEKTHLFDNSILVLLILALLMLIALIMTILDKDYKKKKRKKKKRKKKKSHKKKSTNKKDVSNEKKKEESSPSKKEDTPKTIKKNSKPQEEKKEQSNKKVKSSSSTTKKKNTEKVNEKKEEEELEII